MTWLSVKETAKLLLVSDSAVKKALAKQKYTHRYVNGIGRGGKVLEIALESLPQDAQARYYGNAPEPEDILGYTAAQ